MGYTLKIGQASIDFDQDGLESSIRIIAESVKLENAPAFGEPTDFTNSRWPSYSGWHTAMTALGLEDFCFGEHGVMREHPGCYPLTKEHKALVDDAKEKFYKKYPKCVAGFSPIEDDPNWTVENTYAVRLEWLVFWIDWALENCKIPVFYNS